MPKPFAPESIPLVMCCDENYFTYAAVVIQSLLDNREPKSSYDIVIMTAGDISEERQNKLTTVVKDQPGVCLRFFDLGTQADRCDKLFISRNVSAATYYRLLIPEVFQHYKRVIYLDCDMVILKDLKPLFETNLDGKAVGAVFDIGSLSRGTEEYIDNLAKTYDNFHYINAGLLIMDISKTREVDKEKDLISMAMENSYEYHDQDVINIAFAGNIKLISPKWNLLPACARPCFAPDKTELKQLMDDEYRQASQSPAIIHFAASKPGKDLNVDKAPLFWQYAGKTPFGDQMLKQAIGHRPAPQLKCFEKIFSIKNVGNYKAISLLGFSFWLMRKQARTIVRQFYKT